VKSTAGLIFDLNLVSYPKSVSRTRFPHLSPRSKLTRSATSTAIVESCREGSQVARAVPGPEAFQVRIVPAEIHY